MTKDHRAFEAETAPVSALRLENRAQLDEKPVRKKPRPQNRINTLITVEMIHKIIERTKAL